MRRIVDWLLRRPKLRNRAGGMAWVCGVNDVPGAEVLNNRAVKTVRLLSSGMWAIDPPQRFCIGCDAKFPGDRVALAGDVVTVISMADECLEPWKEDGVTDAEVRTLYESPRVPVDA